MTNTVSKTSKIHLQGPMEWYFESLVRRDVGDSAPEIRNICNRPVSMACRSSNDLSTFNFSRSPPSFWQTVRALSQSRLSLCTLMHKFRYFSSV